MTNLEVKEKIDHLDRGGQLSIAEQKAVCKSLLRANHRIRELKRQTLADWHGLGPEADALA